MIPQFDIAVIGAGIVGLTAALGMARRGLSVAVIDKTALTFSTVNSRVYAVNLASQHLLEQLGVWSALPASMLSPYEHMHVWDGTTGAHLDFDAREVAAACLGYIIEENLLKNTLLQALKPCENVNLFALEEVVDVEEAAEFITLKSTKKQWTATLLLIADGAHSPVRNRLNVPFKEWSYHQQALTVTVSTEKPHQKTAWQVFHSEEPLAFLPLSDPHTCSIVWSVSPKRSRQLLEMPAAAFEAQITTAFENRLGKVRITSTRQAFPLRMRHAKTYTGARWALLGDAAHTIHPLAGLGLNMGLADVSCFLACFDQSQHGKLSRQLAIYQRTRKHALWQVIVFMEIIKMAFAPSSLPFRWIRSLGLAACNTFPALKRSLIHHAMGDREVL